MFDFLNDLTLAAYLRGTRSIPFAHGLCLGLHFLNLDLSDSYQRCHISLLVGRLQLLQAAWFTDHTCRLFLNLHQSRCFFLQVKVSSLFIQGVLIWGIFVFSTGTSRLFLT